MLPTEACSASYLAYHVFSLFTFSHFGTQVLGLSFLFSQCRNTKQITHILPDFILLTISFKGNIEVHSFKLIRLPFSVSPGKIQTPGACKSLLCAHPHTIPRSPVLSAASLEEESHAEASSFQTPSSECDEALLIFTVRREIKRARAAPKEAWKSPVLTKNMTKKPIRSHSVTPLDLEAAGTHINRHAFRTGPPIIQNWPSYNSRGDSAPLGKDYFVVFAFFFFLIN